MKNELSNDVYRGFTQAQIDALYNNQAACENIGTIFADMQAQSKNVYTLFNVQRDIKYGQTQRTTFDFFDSGVESAPTFLFLHGGYWTHCNKEDFAFIAEGILKSGINVILAEYDRAPNVTMTQIVQEVNELLNHLNDNQASYHIIQGKFVLAGHSAGGHLTAMFREHPLVSHAMPLSPLVDLYPISLSYLNKQLKLTDEEIKEFSPIHHIKPSIPTSIHNGSQELMELIRHSLDYAEALYAAQNNVVYQQVDGCDHFTELYQFNYPDGMLLKSLQHLLTL
ncbi:MAG: alpha/beta hydrolase [Burkholderiales bacterium]|nr:alpha/beta hydrolase [Burkholderiales bacterium]